MHYRLAANLLLRRGHHVAMYTSTPRSRLRGFESGLQHKFVPAPLNMANGLLRVSFGVRLEALDSVLFDHLVALRLQPADLLIGAASSSLATGKAIKRRGGMYVLDRACPDIRVQSAQTQEEARKVGALTQPNPPWSIERQVAEYEEADFIISPSNYSRDSFPEHLRQKAILCPLYGRAMMAPRPTKPLGETFIVGCVGGQALRKGYLYLLQAWKQLNLPGAELHIRSGSNFNDYPVLAKLLADQPSVKVIDYVPDIRQFYAQCDAFILPSVDDGFGMALFEAVGNGVPSIATRNTGASELLRPEHDFLLIDAFSVEQIRDSILRLYESADLRDKLTHNGAAAVAALQSDGDVRCYEEGVDRLLDAVRLRSQSLVAA